MKTPLFQSHGGPSLNRTASQTVSPTHKCRPLTWVKAFSSLPLQDGLVHSLLSSWRPLHSAQPCTDELHRLCLCWIPVLQVTLHFDHGPHSSHWPSTGKMPNERQTWKWMQVARWGFNKKPGKVSKIFQDNLYPQCYNGQQELNVQMHYSLCCFQENWLKMLINITQPLHRNSTAQKDLCWKWRLHKHLDQCYRNVTQAFKIQLLIHRSTGLVSVSCVLLFFYQINLQLDTFPILRPKSADAVFNNVRPCAWF